MLELVRSHTKPRMARYEFAWHGLDEAHGAVWQAIRDLFPSHAMADQTDYGCLLISWSLRDGRRACTHFAAPVIVRIAPGLLVALWTCDEQSRRDIAELQAQIVSDALADYDPHSRVPSCGVIVLGE
jgi:hypothetical protein